jgi:hypothetical protein
LVEQLERQPDHRSSGGQFSVEPLDVPPDACSLVVDRDELLFDFLLR